MTLARCDRAGVAPWWAPSQESHTDVVAQQPGDDAYNHHDGHEDNDDNDGDDDGDDEESHTDVTCSSSCICCLKLCWWEREWGRV